MSKIHNRVLLLITKIDNLPQIIAEGENLEKLLGCGVTLLYVKEEKLFELPLFSGKDESLSVVEDEIKKMLKNTSRDEWVVMVKDDDIADRAVVEAKREGAMMIVSDEHSDISSLVHKSDVPVLILKKDASHNRKRPMIVLDPAFDSIMADRVFDFISKISATDAEPLCYMDYQCILDMADPAIDPLMGTTIAPELQLEEESEVIEAVKKRFLSFCSEKSIPAIFEIGSAGVIDDILSQAKEQNSDFIIVLAEDKDTLLADGAREIAKESSIDTMVIYAFTLP